MVKTRCLWIASLLTSCAWMVVFDSLPAQESKTNAQAEHAVRLSELRKWTKYEGNPIMPSTGVGPCAPCVLDMKDGTYQMYYHEKIPGGGAGINLAFADVKTPWKWTLYAENPVFGPNRKEPDAPDGRMVRYARVVPVTDTTWHMYYTGAPRRGSKCKINWNGLMARSEDSGLTWKRVPEFHLPHGSEKLPYSQRGVVGLFVWGPAQSKAAGMPSPWNMWYTAFERNLWPTMLVGICHATSDDGIRWTNCANNPVLRADDPFAGPDGRSRRQAIVQEFRHAASGKERLRLHQQNSRVWCLPWVVFDQGILKMWHTKWGVEGRPYRICYAESRDGINWTTDIEAVELDVSKTGFDSDRTEYPCVIKTKTQWRLWYSGNGFTGIGYASAPIE